MTVIQELLDTASDRRKRSSQL